MLEIIPSWTQIVCKREQGEKAWVVQNFYKTFMSQTGFNLDFRLQN
jgi:hypothetical protein